LKQQKLLLERQQKQEEALLELLQLQDDNGEEEIQEELLIAEQRPQLIQQQQQLHLQQQHRQQKEQQQELQALQQKHAQSQLVHQPQHVQQPQQQQPQLIQQTQQLKTQELQQSPIQKSQIIQQPQIVEQPHFVQQSQIVQQPQQQQQIQYTTVSTQQQTIKQLPHSQQLLQQQLQQILSTNKNYSQRIVVLGSQSQQQQLVAQQPQHIVTTNTTSQQQLLSQQKQCVVTTGNTEQQPQQIQRVVVTSTSQQQQQHQMQRVVVTGNGQQQQQQMQRVVVGTVNQQQQLQQMQDVVVSGTTSQQQSQQTQRVVSAAGQQQQQQIQQIQHLVVPGTTCQQPSQRVIVSTTSQQLQQIQHVVVSGTTSQQQSQQIQRVIVSTAGQQQQQQIQQIPHIVVPGTISQQQSQQMQCVVVTSASDQQQQLAQQIQPSAQRIVIGQLKPSQQTQQSSSQCGVVFGQLHQQDMQRPIAEKQQQQRVVITGQQQLLKLSQQQQQSPQQQLVQQILQPIQQQQQKQQQQQRVVTTQQQQVVQQLQQQQVVQQLQQQQQIIQPQQKLTQCVVIAQQNQQNINVNSSDESLLQELQINQLQLPVEPPQKQVQQHQINKQPQQQHQQQKQQIQQDKQLHQQQVEQHMGQLNRSGVVVGQLPRPIQSEPEEIQQQFKLQQLQRQKLHNRLLKEQQTQQQQQQQKRLNEQQLQKKCYQQQLREQVLLKQHLKQQQIQQQLLLRQKASPESRLLIVMDDNQEQMLKDDKEEINHCEKSPVPITLSSIIEDVANQQFRLNNKGHIDNCMEIDEEKLVLLSSSSDEDEADEVIYKQRNLLLEAERLVIERYNALSVALGPKHLLHYHKILMTWLGGQLSQKNFESDIQKVIYMSRTLAKTTGDSIGNIDNEPVIVTDTSASITVTSNAYIGSTQDLKMSLTRKAKRVKATLKKKSASISKETRPKTKTMAHVASPLNKEVEEKRETTANMEMNKANVKETNLSLHNALMASLATWMPLNSQKAERRMARARGVTVTGCPLRLYTYSDVPQARGPSNHWYPEEPGSLAYWYWPDHLSYSLSPVKNNDEKQFTWEKQKKDSANAIAAAVLLRPPSRTMLPLLLQMATKTEAARITQQMQWPERYPMKHDINATKKFRWHQLKEENKLATMVRLRDGHTKLLSELKVRSRELGIQERQIMEGLRRLQTRILQRRRKLLALFEIRKENLKVRIYRYCDRSWQERPEDQVRRQLLIEATKTMDDEESDDDKTEDDDDRQHFILRQHLERVRLLNENQGQQQYQLETKPTFSIPRQTDRRGRPQSMALTMKLLRDRLRYQKSLRMLQSIRQEQLQVSKHTDRVRELRHKNCPCGESNDRPCRYRKQMRKFRKQLQVLELNAVEDKVNKELCNDAEKEKAVAKESEKLETMVAENKKTKTKKKKVVTAKVKKTKTVTKKAITKAESQIGSVDNNKVIDGASTATTISSTTKTTHKITNNAATKTNTTTTKIAAPQVLDFIDLVEDEEKHDTGSDCELIQDKSSLPTRSNVANVTRRRRQPLRRKDGKFTVNVVAAATRAAQAALAASRRTQKRRTEAAATASAATISESIDLTVEEDDDNNRRASVLMPPPPPPSKITITPKKPSTGARYLKQQQLLLDRHKQLERMRQEEEKRQELTHELQEKDNVEPLMESENVSASLPSVQLIRPRRRDESLETISHDFDKKLHSDKDDEFIHLVHGMGREKDGLQSNYHFYYGDGDYYSSDDEMTELLSNEPPFPPLLHDLRMDQFPQSSIRVPDATRTTSVIQSLPQSTSSSSVDLDVREYELGQQNMGPVNKRKRKINEPIEKELFYKQLKLELQERPGLRQEEKHQHKNGNKSVTCNRRMDTAESYQQQKINKAQKQQSVELQSAQRKCQVANKLLDVEENSYREEKSCPELNFEHKQTKFNESKIIQVVPVTKNQSHSKRQSKHVDSQKLRQRKHKNESTITTEEKPLDLKNKKPETTVDIEQLQFVKRNDEYPREKNQDVESEKKRTIKSSKVNVNHSKYSRDLEKNKHVFTDHFEKLVSDVTTGKFNYMNMQNLLNKYLELVVSLPPEHHLQQMVYLKQQVRPLKYVAIQSDSIADMEIKMLKQALPLPIPTVNHDETRKTLEEIQNLLTKIRQQRAIIQQSLNISDINDKSSSEVSAESVQFSTNTVYEDLKFWFGLSPNKNEANDDNEQRMSKIKEMIDQCFLSSCGQISARLTDVKMQQLGRNGQEKFEQDETEDGQRREQKIIELLLLEKKSLMKPNEVEELNRKPAQDIQLKQRKQLNRPMRIKRIKRLRQQEKELKLKKIRLIRDMRRKQRIQERSKHLQESTCHWHLGKFLLSPIPFNELCPLREQLMLKIVENKNVEQQHSNNMIITAVKKLKYNYALKLDSAHYIKRGSAMWWTKIGLPRRISPLVMRVNKRSDEQTGQIAMGRITDQPQLTRPQVREVAATVVLKDQKQIISRFNEREKLIKFLNPKLLRMMTETEEKWLSELQAKSVELNQQRNVHWNAMVEKQEQQVKLLFLFDEKQRTQDRKYEHHVEDILIAVDPTQDVSKIWKKLDVVREVNEQRWKCKLQEFLKLEYTNKMFCKELYDRLVMSQYVYVQKHQKTNAIAAFKQLPYQPLNLQSNSPQNLLVKKHSLQKSKQHQQHSSQKLIDHQPEKIVSNVKLHSKQLGVDNHRQPQRQDNQKPQLMKPTRQNHGGCKTSIINIKPLIMANLKHLRNRILNIKSRRQNRQQPQRSVSIASSIADAIGKKPRKQEEQNKSTEWILRKLTYLLHNQRIVLQREMDRINENYPVKLDIEEEPSVSLTHITSIHQPSTNLALQQPSTSKQQLPMPPIILTPQLSEQQSTQSRMTTSKLAVHRQQQKHQFVEQKLARINSQLKPLMELWLCSLQFPARWMHQQLDEIEEIKREESKRSGGRQRKQQNRQNDGQLVAATNAATTEWPWQQMKQIYEYLEWRQQRVRELVNEFALAMPREQKELLKMAVSRTKQPPSTYSVLLKLQQPLTSSRKCLTYSVLLKLQQPLTSESQPLMYSSVLILQQTANRTEPSKYSALLRLQHPKTSNQMCSSYSMSLVPQQLLTTKQQSSVILTPQKSSTFQSKFPNTSVVITPQRLLTSKQQSSLCPVILTPQQPSTVEDQPSTSSVIHTLHTQKPSITTIPETVMFQPNEELHHQLNDNQQITKDKRRFISRESDQNEDGCKKLKVTSTTKRPRSPSNPVCPKRLRSTPHFQTNKLSSNFVTFDDTIIILDSDDESEFNNSGSEADTSSDLFDSSSQSSMSDNTHRPVTNMSVQISDKSPLTIKFIKTKPLPSTVIPSATTKSVKDDTTIVPKETKNKEYIDEMKNDDIKTIIGKNQIDKTPSTVTDRRPAASIVYTDIVTGGPADVTVIPCKPTEATTIGSSTGSLTVGCKPLKIAVIKCAPPAEAPVGGNHPVKTVPEAEKSVKLMVVMNRQMKVADVVSKLTEATVAAARKTPVVVVRNPRTTGSAEEPKMARSTKKRRMDRLKTKRTGVTTNRRRSIIRRKKTTVRRRRHLLRTVTVDTHGPAVPAFRDHGFADGSIEQAVHGRFLATIMTMTAAHSVASYVPPRRSQALLKRAIMNEEKNRTAGKNGGGHEPGDKVTASTNTPVPLSSVMDCLENKEECPTNACSRGVHQWSGCARTEGTALVALIKKTKASQATDTPTSAVRSSRSVASKMTTAVTPANRSVSATVTTTGRDRVRPVAGKRSASVASVATPTSLPSAPTIEPNKLSKSTCQTSAKAAVTGDGSSKRSDSTVRSSRSTASKMTTAVTPANRSVSATVTTTGRDRVRPVAGKRSASVASMATPSSLPSAPTIEPNKRSKSARQPSANAAVRDDGSSKRSELAVPPPSPPPTAMTTITEEETRTVTITRTVCPAVQPPMDVTADACALVVSTCEKFVRAMVMERFRKAGRGAGTLELRRRETYAAAVAVDDSIRPTSEYCRTTVGTTAATAVDTVNEENICGRPMTKAVTIVRTEPNGTFVETVETTEKTHVTTTVHSDNDVGRRSRSAVVDGTSARTRGVVVRKTTAVLAAKTRDVRPVTAAATRNAGPPVTSPAVTSGFVAEHGRSLLRPEFHRRRPFDTLTSTCVTAAAEATAVNDAAYAYFDNDPDEWLATDDRSCYFGDRGMLPPVSRLNDFLTNDDDDDDDDPRGTSAANRWRPSRRADVLSTTEEDSQALMIRRRQRLLDEVVRQWDQSKRLQQVMEQRFQQQQNETPDSPDEYYRKFLRLQFGSTKDTPANDGDRPRGLITW